MIFFSKDMMSDNLVIAPVFSHTFSMSDINTASHKVYTVQRFCLNKRNGGMWEYLFYDIS